MAQAQHRCGQHVTTRGRVSPGGVSKQTLGEATRAELGPQHLAWVYNDLTTTSLGIKGNHPQMALFQGSEQF